MASERKQASETTEDSDQANGSVKRFAGFGTREKREELLFAALPDGLLGAFADAVVAEGAALLLALTSDGGAFSITILNNGSRVKSYPASVEDLAEEMRFVLE